MSDENQNSADATQATTEQATPQFSIQRIYTKDISFKHQILQLFFKKTGNLKFN